MGGGTASFENSLLLTAFRGSIGLGRRLQWGAKRHAWLADAQGRFARKA